MDSNSPCKIRYYSCILSNYTKMCSDVHISQCIALQGLPSILRMGESYILSPDLLRYVSHYSSGYMLMSCSFQFFSPLNFSLCLSHHIATVISRSTTVFVNVHRDSSKLPLVFTDSGYFCFFLNISKCLRFFILVVHALFISSFFRFLFANTYDFKTLYRTERPAILSSKNITKTNVFLI